MIKILERYIMKTVLYAIGLVALIITGVLFLMMLLRELKNMGEGDYSFIQAMIYVFLRLPNELYHFSPMLILLGSIIGLSILASHRELAVMRTSGFSIKRIMASVFGAALILILIISIIGEGFAPRLGYKAQIRKETAQNAGQAVVTTAGVWFHISNNFIHVQRVVGRNLLEGITRYEFDHKRKLQTAYYAKTLTLENHQWQMNDGVKTKFYADETKSQVFQKESWNLIFNPNLLNIGLMNANEMSLNKLANLSDYLEQNGLEATEYQYVFWRRIFQPLASLVMIFLSIPFVLGVMGSSTLGMRLLIGTIVGFVFFIANAFLGQLCIVYQFPAFLAVSFPIFLFAIVGLLMFKRWVY